MDVPSLPLVSAGFPSPAESFSEKRLNVADLLVPHPDFTYFMRVEGESMRGAGLHANDILVVDRSLDAVNNSIIVATLNGGFVVKRILFEAQGVTLLSEHPRYPAITVQPEDGFSVWGVVTYSLHPVVAHSTRGPIVPAQHPQRGPERKKLR